MEKLPAALFRAAILAVHAVANRSGPPKDVYSTVIWAAEFTEAPIMFADGAGLSREYEAEPEDRRTGDAVSAIV